MTPTDQLRAAKALIPDEMTRDERSFLLYAESCCVDAGGLLVAERMNADDHAAAARFVALGLMTFGRIPSELLATSFASPTHYAELTEAGWQLAWQLRRERGDKRGPKATAVFEHPLVIERRAISLADREAQS